jgi:hypothetical protein
MENIIGILAFIVIAGFIMWALHDANDDNDGPQMGGA